MTDAAPIATYRLQLRPGFGFDEAAALAPYLRALGVSHVYCSPYLAAAPGSTHGYDVVDPSRVNQELGGEPGHARMGAAFQAAGLRQLLDIVPNHMAVVRDNPWWWDVLENGPSSRYARFFDVEWAPPEERLRNRVLLPVLGDHVGRVIERREVLLAREGGSFVVKYHEHRAPVAPRSLSPLVARAAQRLGSDELAFLADALEFLPPATTTDRASLDRRHRDKEVLRRHIDRLCRESPEIARALDEAVAMLNTDPDAMDAFLSQQHCRLAYWRTAAHDLGYRRFFDVNSLVALRVEDEQVFAETHGLVMKWLAEGVIDGVRVDHPDGLRDPQGYLKRLRQVRGDAWIVVEKILTSDERLPSTWPVDGTTGYDFLALVGGLLVQPAGEAALTELHATFTQKAADFAERALDGKHYALKELLDSDVNRLTALFLQICEEHRRFRDFSRHDVREVLRETLASFPVYRTYVRGDPRTVSPTDTLVVGQAVAAARARRADLDGELFQFLSDILLLQVPGERATELAFRFQQLSSSAMAKGVEDTAFYTDARLLALNEVGSNPARFGVSLSEFHGRCEEQRRWPRSLLATSTHDTKRSEDVRARLALLSEVPAAWRELVHRLVALTGQHLSDGQPDPACRYFFFQTLVGAWPLSVERAQASMQKAAREAKTSTSWNHPNAAFEAALGHFVEATMADPEVVTTLESFVAGLVLPGRLNSLTQTLLKLMAPGVPDIYQGCELWDLSLVDPDNRRPVDFEVRRRLLTSLAGSPEEVLAGMDEGLPKLFLIQRALSLRRARPAPFRDGAYHPLVAEGPRAEHAVAFTRGNEILVLAPRWPIGLASGWGETKLPVPQGTWLNVLTGETFEGGPRPIGELLGRFPVLLASVTGGAP